VNWADGELATSKKRETEALDLVKSFTALMASPSDVITKVVLIDSRLNQKGHVTGSKIVTILVDFSAYIETMLKEMRQLLGHHDLDQVMDFTQFPELPFVVGTPVRRTPSVSQQLRTKGLRDALHWFSEPFSS